MVFKFNTSPLRRNFLRYGVSLSSGIMTPAVFTACRPRVSTQEAIPREAFRQPNLIEAKDGVLDLTLVASYFQTQIGGVSSSQRHLVRLRAYGHNDAGPECTGPTLVVRGGDQLRIKLINNLPVNPPVAAFRDPTNYMRPNTTNLHVHGLHVSPGVSTRQEAVEYGDYVIDANNNGVQPRGDSRQYVYQIPKDHPAGVFYYHPQFHGSSAIQNASFMNGAILVRGPVDELPAMAQASELLFVFQAPYYTSQNLPHDDTLRAGTLEKFSQIARQPSGEGIQRPGSLGIQPVLINGVRQPTIVMKRGEVQRWRFINTQIFNYLNLSLDEHVLHEYMTDGWGRKDYRNHPDARELNSNGLLLTPGNRSSVLVKAGAPGEYYLRSLPFHIAQGREKAVLPEDILARIIVLEDSQPMSLAPAPLPVGDFLSPITDAEFAQAGGRKRSIVFNFIGNESPVQLQASNSIIQNVILDAIEEWTIFNCNSISFPFHVHVNPMYVIRINGLAVDPYWCDTLPLPPDGTPEMPTSVTVRIRFKDFAGPFVLHNQMLHYSDLGMIQRVTVIPA